MPDEEQALDAFDKELFAHVRSIGFECGARASCTTSPAAPSRIRRACRNIGWMYRRLHAAAVTFAVVADFVLGTLGGELKRRESISARLGDVLSELYLLSCVLKRFEDDGAPAEDLPLVEYAVRDGLHTIQNQLDGVLCNLPMRPAAWFLRLIAFPLGRRKRAPADRLTHACANSIALAVGCARPADRGHVCQPQARRRHGTHRSRAGRGGGARPHRGKNPRAARPQALPKPITRNWSQTKVITPEEAQRTGLVEETYPRRHQVDDFDRGRTHARANARA